MVSALIASKRVELGIEAVSRIPDAHLVVAGDGPLRDVIEASAARILPGRFTRLSVPPKRMPALYRSADVFLHLSKDEPFGNVFLEAMACGLPVVAHDSARSRWILGDDEFLADTATPTAITEQIELARGSSSAQVQQRAIKSAAFSWTNIAEMYRKFLQEVISS
jgi:glycosyltransferase involved in cell wall biosynthesis